MSPHSKCLRTVIRRTPLLQDLAWNGGDARSVACARWDRARAEVAGRFVSRTGVAWGAAREERGRALSVENLTDFFGAALILFALRH